MGEKTEIGWCDHTFNSWVGCTKVSPACDHCYAEGWAKRSGMVKWGNHPRRRTSESYWRQPIKWNRLAEASGTRKRVFCCSLADVFDNQVPEQWRFDLYNLIDKTPRLDWLLLTKRPQNIAKMMPEMSVRPNIWLGMTAENQDEFDRRWRYLVLRREVRFVSYEPALGPLSIRAHAMVPDWIIFGGESGPHRRPVALAWARAIRDECASRGVAFFGKQLDKVKPLPADLMVREFPNV